jgi:hypothetical protein
LERYDTGLDLNALPHFPLTRMRGDSFDGIRVLHETPKAREEILRGRGWEAHLCCPAEAWRGDLDGNGTQDYVVFITGPFWNGRITPPFSLPILLMDAKGLPVPFFTTLYHGENGDGIKHLLRLREDRKAQLLIQSYDEGTSDPSAGVFGSGHWVNQIYEFHNFAAVEIKGILGGVAFPFVHNWTYGPQGPGGITLPVEPPRILDHGTQGSQAVTIRQVEQTGLGRISIEPVAGCTDFDASVVVYDRRGKREIAFPNLFHPYLMQLLERIRADHARVELRGLNECHANLLWATN